MPVLSAFAVVAVVAAVELLSAVAGEEHITYLGDLQFLYALLDELTRPAERKD